MMPRIKIDNDAHRIIKKYKDDLGDQGIEGADFSDAIRVMDRRIQEQGRGITAFDP